MREKKVCACVCEREEGGVCAWVCNKAGGGEEEQCREVYLHRKRLTI